ncbi:SgcJ/EcaC family oxidoreductase [Luteimonas sp. SJ-92]|uniref:SgcJ/EcaC family oxidoreductase n=1 Tax=Luteimonas salinisoli TaxID=2752307 RepID=A0A853JAI0_9GAMM|nr:SgcJ/EcaC family oxidoreductase [Luteimonas salinisoli]NZA25677.1 SgcJ/EcaC family oxidoreductase [Luteimonas salinisoli]
MSEEIRQLVQRWQAAIRAGDMDGILADHADDVLMFDVPEPLQSVGKAQYRKTWELFFEYGSPGDDVFTIEDLRITAGDDVAFCTGLLRIGGSARPVCRLTLGMTKVDGRWLIAHEHHSAPHALQPAAAT